MRSSCLLLLHHRYPRPFVIILSPIKNYFGAYYTEEFIQILKWVVLIIPTFMLTNFLTHGYLYSTGNAKLHLKIMLFFGVLNVVLDYYFISLFGFIGVIYVTVICSVLAQNLTVGLLHRKLKNLQKFF